MTTTSSMLIPNAAGMNVSGDYLFLSTHSSEIITIDISSPSSPQQVASFDLPAGNPWDIMVSGNRAPYTQQQASCWAANCQLATLTEGLAGCTRVGLDAEWRHPRVFPSLFTPHQHACDQIVHHMLLLGAISLLQIATNTNTVYVLDCVSRA